MSSIVERADAYVPVEPTESELDILKGAFVTGSNEALAAYAVGRSERWVRYVKSNFPAIAEKIEFWKAVADGLVMQASHKTAVKHLGRDGAADRIFWLKNREKWTDRHLVTGKLDVGFFPQVVAASMDPALEVQVRKRLEASGAKGLPPPRPEVLELQRAEDGALQPAKK